MAAPVASLTENLRSLNETLETAKVAGNWCSMAAAVDSLAENLPSVNERLPISDQKRNMAAALASLTENFQTINEVLEDLFVDDRKRKMAAALASLMENIHTVNEALEGSLTENFQSVSVVLEKEKKHLSQRVQIFEEEIHKKREERQKSSESIMKGMHDARRQFDNVNSQLNNLTQKYGKMIFGEEFDKMPEEQRKLSALIMKEEGKINEFGKKKSTPALMGVESVDYLEHFAGGKSTKAIQFAQESESILTGKSCGDPSADQ